MAAHTQAGIRTSDNRFAQEFEYLYKRLATVDNLIRTLEDYARVRLEPVPAVQDKQPDRAGLENAGQGRLRTA